MMSESGFEEGKRMSVRFLCHVEDVSGGFGEVCWGVPRGEVQAVFESPPASSKTDEETESEALEVQSSPSAGAPGPKGPRSKKADKKLDTPRKSWTKMTPELFVKIHHWEEAQKGAIKQADIEKKWNVNRTTYYRWKQRRMNSPWYMKNHTLFKK
eukprot:TRINITY_DN4881_c0_g1_i1.p2 TRINITY_DN4881_c0_g1~~TRINITY_DN4881_c0_g1_i1.p2  ORF type:complete len:155 (+),score=16.40 TRINITY_DN4881_c0_g1_i1:116-580(+)